MLLAFLILSFAGVARTEQIWAEVDRPQDGERVRGPYGLVEVAGWAGTGLRGDHEVVVVIDRSGSTFRPSGVDVDGDGVVGRLVSLGGAPGLGRRGITDPDDSIAQAQQLAARLLIERLDTSSTRMGIVTFGRTERVLARIGTPREELLSALDRIPNRPEKGGTYFYGAIIACIKVFEQSAAAGERSLHRSIIFLSDGLPNEPPPESFAAKAAVRASRHAARAKIRLYAFALGATVMSRPGVFMEMVEANGGELLLVDTPGDIIDYVPHISLTKLRGIRVENLTIGKRARAVRLFPDGSFDAFAPLEPGENRLRVTIDGEADSQRILELSVTFEKTAGNTAEERRQLELLLERLKVRTIETELAEQAMRKRERALERQLTIELERSPPRTDGP